MSGCDLTALLSVDLARVLSAIELGDLTVPLTRPALAARGFGDLSDALAPLLGLDRPTVLAVLNAIRAERKHGGLETVDLVWTGPEAEGSTARDTAVVLRELFTSAEERVLIAGFTFDHGEEILRPLWERMRDRGVSTTIFMDVKRARADEDPAAVAQSAADRFLEENWTFGAPYPELYYAPETVAPLSTVSLHAKCVVVDGQRALVTSANFTDRGQSRNIEAGARITSRDFALRLEAQWRGLGQLGLVHQIVREGLRLEE